MRGHTDIWFEDADFYYSGNSYDNCDEVFILQPYTWYSTGGTVAYTNDHSVPTDADFIEKSRLNTDDTTAGRSYAQGDVNDGVADTIRIRFTSNTAGKVYMNPTAARWTLLNWSSPTAAFTTWKAEVTAWIATALDTERTAGVPIAEYADWSLQIHELDTDIITVIFFPGNDPEADEIVSEVV